VLFLLLLIGKALSTPHSPDSSGNSSGRDPSGSSGQDRTTSDLQPHQAASCSADTPSDAADAPAHSAANPSISSGSASVARGVYFRWLIGLSLVGCLSVLVFLPQLISSRWVYQPMLERMHAGNFRFSVDAVELHWFRPIRFRGITIAERVPDNLTASERPPLVRVHEVVSDRGLWRYLTSGRELGRLEIFQPAADFELLQEHGSVRELLRALGGHADDRESKARRRHPAVNIAIAIRGGRIVVRRPSQTDPLVVVPAFDLDLAYRAAEDQSWLHIEPTRLLDRVALTPELMQLGLEYVVPMLARAAWLSGDVSVDLGAIDIPLARPIETVGTAAVTFHTVRAGLSDPALEAGLRRVALLMGRDQVSELILADGTVAEVVMSDAAVTHSGMKFGLPRVDPRLQMASHGSVSLIDRTLDLVLSIPVPVEFLARRDTVRDIGVPMVRLPVQGTLGSPELQWSQLRGDSATVIGTIGDRLGDEAPATTAVIEALGRVTSGDADQAIRSTAQMLLELRQRRAQQRREAAQERDAGAIRADNVLEDTDRIATPSDLQPADDQPASPPRRRPILDRLRPRAAD
jgi:hypothetical protein